MGKTQLMPLSIPKHCRRTHLEKLSKQDWTSLSLVVYLRCLSARLVSTLKPAFFFFFLTGFLAAECTAVWEGCGPTTHFDFVTGFSVIYLFIYCVGVLLRFAFVCKMSSLKQSTVVCKPGHSKSTFAFNPAEFISTLVLQENNEVDSRVYPRLRVGRDRKSVV